jgi:hypothetical protein
MSQNKTTATGLSAAAFIAAVEPAARRDEARALDAIFRAATGWEPRMWGPTIIGYGRYAYTYDSGRTGEMCATGFSPRGRAISIYILPGYGDYGDLLARLGRHKSGKACLYLNRLSDADPDVLSDLIKRGVADLSARWPVQAD